VQHEDISTADGFGESGGDLHLSTKVGIFRLELKHFCDFLIGDELLEVAVLRIGMRG
jgi:hypothetical protein